MQLYHLLDTKNFLEDLGMFTHQEISNRFQLKKNYSVKKVCERQILLNERYVLVEDKIYHETNEEGFTQQLFYENDEFLYYMTIDSSILIKSKKTGKETIHNFPTNQIFHVDSKSFRLDKIYQKFFGTL